MNFYLFGEMNDPMGELKWLENTLKDIEVNG
jgi:hypothetical protein